MTVSSVRSGPTIWARRLCLDNNEDILNLAKADQLIMRLDNLATSREEVLCNAISNGKRIRQAERRAQTNKPRRALLLATSTTNVTVSLSSLSHLASDRCGDNSHQPVWGLNVPSVLYHLHTATNGGEQQRRLNPLPVPRTTWDGSLRPVGCV